METQLLEETNVANPNTRVVVEEDISGPLVFSCLKCRVIVGDSFSFMKSDAEMQTITLTAASGIQRSADVYTSKSGPDVGSTYFRFTCATCQNSLGKYYLTTSKDLDDLREKFTFSVDSINSYELGKSQHGKGRITDVVVEPQKTDTSNCSSSSSTSKLLANGKNNQNDNNYSNSSSTTGEGGIGLDGDRGGGEKKLTVVEELQAEILKVQHIIFDLSSRMINQEQAMTAVFYSLGQNVIGQATNQSGDGDKRDGDERGRDIMGQGQGQGRGRCREAVLQSADNNNASEVDCGDSNNNAGGNDTDTDSRKRPKT